MDVQQPLQRGIFAVVNTQEKIWVPFKYETLPIFYFGYWRMGLGVKECDVLTEEDKGKPEKDFPYSVALKAESAMIGSECLQFGMQHKKFSKQC